MPLPPAKKNEPPPAATKTQVADAQTRGCPVAEWDLDGEGAIVADTFSLFLERFRNDLLSGRCEFVEGIGIVEKMKTSARAAAATGRGRGK